MEKDLKISQLPAVTNPTGAEMIPVALGGGNGKLTLEQIVEKAKDEMATVASGFQEEVMNVQRVSDDAYELAAQIRDERADERKQFGFVGGIDKKGLLNPASTSWHSSDFIPINHSEPIVCNITTNSDNSYKDGGIYFYDANKNYISFINVTTHVKYEIAVADIPENAVFFRASEVKQATDGWYHNGSNLESREGATSDAISKGKVALFDDMWIEAGYCRNNRHTSIDRKNHPDAPYICNGLPCTYAEAQRIYGFKDMPWLSWSDNGWSMNGVTLKTNLFPIARIVGCNISCYGGVIDYFRVACSDEKSDAAAFAITAIFPNCIKVIGKLQQPSRLDFSACPRLEHVEIISLKYDLSLVVCSKLDLESFQIMVEYAQNTSTITITVHPDIYAKLSDTSNTEWHKVMTDAAAKNISFGTNA